MYRRLMAYLEKNGILCDSQYGLREKHSTEHTLIDIVNQIQSLFDKGMLSCGVFIDLKKNLLIRLTIVFYCKNFITMALEALSMIGSIRISLIVFNQLKLVQRSLLNSPRLVASLKGPCWGLYYSSCTSTIYVDHLINCRFAKKSNFVIFHPYQKKLDRDVMIKIFDIHTKEFVLLDQKSYIKYLGTLIDSNLTWKYHISYITSKISKTIGVIARLRQFVSSSTLLTLYRSLVSPYLLYGLTVWGQAPQIYLNQILVHLIDFLLSLFLFPPVAFQSASFILKQCRF